MYLYFKMSDDVINQLLAVDEIKFCCVFRLHKWNVLCVCASDVPEFRALVSAEAAEDLRSSRDDPERTSRALKKCFTRMMNCEKKVFVDQLNMLVKRISEEGERNETSAEIRRRRLCSLSDDTCVHVFRGCRQRHIQQQRRAVATVTFTVSGRHRMFLSLLPQSYGAAARRGHVSGSERTSRLSFWRSEVNTVDTRASITEL